MTLRAELRAFLRDYWSLLRHWPDRLADRLDDWCDRQVMAMHPPEMIPADDPGFWPNGERPWCLRCDAAWPCDPYSQADERLTARAGGAS